MGQESFSLDGVARLGSSSLTAEDERYHNLKTGDCVSQPSADVLAQLVGLRL